MNYGLILKNLDEYYKNLLIIQYHNKPKAQKTISLIAKLIWINMVLMQVRDAFDWKTATGPQLDIIGRWVGVNRFYGGQLFEDRPWFSLIDWDSEPNEYQGGFSTYENFATLAGGFLDYANIRPKQNVLTDENYRLLIGLKIIKNNINTTAKTIDDAIWDYFKGEVYTTWEVRQLTYHFPKNLTLIMELAYRKKVLPCPTGTQIVLEEIENA